MSAEIIEGQIQHSGLRRRHREKISRWINRLRPARKSARVVMGKPHGGRKGETMVRPLNFEEAGAAGEALARDRELEVTLDDRTRVVSRDLETKGA